MSVLPLSFSQQSRTKIKFQKTNSTWYVNLTYTHTLRTLRPQCRTKRVCLRYTCVLKYGSVMLLEEQREQMCF